jgi:hypothetical protein
LKIISDLIQLDLPTKVRVDVIQWFASSLRGNKNLLTHYLDDLKGCGENLEDIARENFFKIIKSLVKHLRNSDDEKEIKILISALKWKYTARDHGQLRGLDLFRILYEGNGDKNNKLRKIWGRFLDRKVINDENNRQI